MGAEWYNRASICWPHRGASVGRSPCTRLLRLACRPTSHIRPLLASRRPGCARHAALRCRARRRGALAPPGGHRPKLTVPAALPDDRPSLSSLLEPRCHGDRGHTQRRGGWAHLEYPVVLVDLVPQDAHHGARRNQPPHRPLRRTHSPTATIQLIKERSGWRGGGRAGRGPTLQSDAGSYCTTRRPCVCPRSMMYTMLTELAMNSSCSDTAPLKRCLLLTRRRRGARAARAPSCTSCTSTRSSRAGRCSACRTRAHTGTAS